MSTVNKKEKRKSIFKYFCNHLAPSHTLHQTKANYVNQKKKHQMLRKMKNNKKNSSN